MRLHKFLVALLILSFLLTCSSGCTDSTSNKIAMPYDSEYYIGSDWTLDTLTEHFSELGFTNIKPIPCETGSDRYYRNIFDLEIQSSMFSTGPWKTGDVFNPDDELSIYYNKDPLITVENCPDLVTILTSKDMDYMDFCYKYNGHFAKFDAHIIGHIRPEHYLFVAGGDYDGHTDLQYYDPSTYAGLEIKIGDDFWDENIDTNVDLGDHVTVIGRIDADWAKFFKCVYVETLELSPR